MGSEESTAATAVLTEVVSFRQLLPMGFEDFEKGFVAGRRNGLGGLGVGEFSRWLPKEPRFRVVEANMAAKNQLLFV